MDDRHYRTVTEAELQSNEAGAPSGNGRGPYAKDTGDPAPSLGRPSDALAENLRAYRLLRRMTQDQLAARMAHLCHGWGRSTVSAVEGKSRNVTIDELFGLAVSVGVTIGPQPVAPRLAHHWASSRAVIRLWHEDGRTVRVDLAEGVGAATEQELEGIPSPA